MAELMKEALNNKDKGDAGSEQEEKPTKKKPDAKNFYNKNDKIKWMSLAEYEVLNQTTLNDPLLLTFCLTLFSQFMDICIV